MLAFLTNLCEDWRRMRPCECRTEKDVLNLQESNKDIGDYSILIDERLYISLTEQKPGEAPVGSVSMPKSVFDKLFKWYQSEKSNP